MITSNFLHAWHNPRRNMRALSVTVGSLVAAGMLFSVISAVAAPGAPPAPSQEARFLAANEAAMDKMMAGMTANPSGDVDSDFTAMMIPHHQGAIDMASRTDLRKGPGDPPAGAGDSGRSAVRNRCHEAMAGKNSRR